MANNNKKTTIAIISLTITVVVIIAAIVKGYTKMEVEAKGHVTAIKTIKTEGCLPARQSKTDIAVLKEGQKTILGKLDELLEK